MKEKEYLFFGKKISLRFSDKEANNIPVSVVCNETSKAWSKVFNYDTAVRIIEPDDNKLEDLSDHYRKIKQKKSSILVRIINFLPEVFFLLVRVIRSIFGRFVFFSLKGLGLFILLIVIGLMIGAYAMIFLSPLIIASAILVYRQRKEVKQEIEKLQNAVLQYIEENMIPQLESIPVKKK